MAGDYKKLDYGRMSTGIASAFGVGTTGLSTGDITQGTVVDVTVTSGAGSATVSQRRTGAIPIGQSMTYGGGDRGFSWEISDTTLSVETYGGDSGTMSFWVF
jgi:butyrate kinase